MNIRESVAENNFGVAVNHCALSLAIAALEQAGPDDTRLAFEDAVAAYARTPSVANAHKVEMTRQALRHQKLREARRTSG